MKEGETVLDLGSGGRFDCFLAAREVGKNGKVIGVDMTPQMMSKARRNAEKSELNVAEFRLGEIENLPVANGVEDVIISNCVLNLSPDKRRVMQESFRALISGGRLAVSDVVATRELSEETLHDPTRFSGCMADATQLDELQRILQESGFVDILIDSARRLNLGQVSIAKHRCHRDDRNDYVSLSFSTYASRPKMKVRSSSALGRIVRTSKTTLFPPPLKPERMEVKDPCSQKLLGRSNLRPLKRG